MRPLLHLLFAALLWALLSSCSSGEAGLPPAYRQIAVPRARLSAPAARQRGQAIFRQTCALCHGQRADGHGPRAGSLSTPPANLTLPDWQKKATPRYVYWRIREGVRGTDMPAWKALDSGQIWDLVAYIRSLH